MNDQLTIFLPLRGRHLHTLRWLWHANRIALPYRIIVADGDVHPTIERLLSDPATFPDLRFSYHRHADRSFTDFYQKCADSLDLVETPYAMIADNDDFVLPTGVDRCIAVLDDQADVVCALGGIPGFSTIERDDAWNGVLGPLSKVRYRCHDDGSYRPRDFDQPDAAARVRAQAQAYMSLYYGVYRTSALRTIMHELRELDFSDLLMHEFYGAWRTVTLGKVRADPAILCYARQGNTSSGFAFTTDWVDHLLRSRFPQDFQALASRIAAYASDSAVEQSALEADLYREFATYLRRMLGGTVLRHRFPRLFAAKQRLVKARSVFTAPENWRIAREKREFWQKLAADGASPATVADQHAELAAIENTLNSKDFVAFVQANASDLVA